MLASMLMAPAQVLAVCVLPNSNSGENIHPLLEKQLSDCSDKSYMNTLTKHAVSTP